MVQYICLDEMFSPFQSTFQQCRKPCHWNNVVESHCGNLLLQEISPVANYGVCISVNDNWIYLKRIKKAFWGKMCNIKTTRRVEWGFN